MTQPPLDISPATFLEWRSPRRGTANPQNMTNDVWKWLIASGVSAFEINSMFDGPEAFDFGPGWCCNRYGQSTSILPDGRIFFIGGEHEDCYDPDFYIYNDLIIIDTAAKIHIFGYPCEVFPPTDFHSATLCGEDIVLIGNLGYVDDRRTQTQVLRLNTKTLQVSPIETTGESPMWISNHKAVLSNSEGHNEIRITGGNLYLGGQLSLVENIDEWSLDVESWHWTRLTRRPWERFFLFRQDNKSNHLDEMRYICEDKKFRATFKEWNWSRTEERMKQLAKELGTVPDWDLLETQLESLYTPEVATEILPKGWGESTGGADE